MVGGTRLGVDYGSMPDDEKKALMDRIIPNPKPVLAGKKYIKKDKGKTIGWTNDLYRYGRTKKA